MTATRSRVFLGHCVMGMRMVAEAVGPSVLARPLLLSAAATLAIGKHSRNVPAAVREHCLMPRGPSLSWICPNGLDSRGVGFGCDTDGTQRATELLHVGVGPQAGLLGKVEQYCGEAAMEVA